MEEYSIKVFPAAEEDLNEIIEYLNTLSPQAAVKYYDLIVEKIGTLASMPERCPLLKDAQLRLRGYRMLLVKDYAVFYVIQNKTVEIRRILYAKRNFGWLL
jgi:plasmid stabilization system protein ParE